MGKGMKIFRKFMIGMLATLVLVGGAVTLFYIFGDNDGVAPERNPRVRDVRGDALRESDAADGYDFSLVDEPGTDFRFWQRVSSVSEDTGYWQFYPIMPWNILPGETAVLSVSATNFRGWEVDTDFAHVELFDEHFDENNAFVSFIMPEDEVSIIALYSDEIPYINFDSQKEKIRAFSDIHEHGEAPVAASSVIVPELGVTIPMPHAILGQTYFVEFGPPAIDVPEGARLVWQWNLPSPQLDGLIWVNYADGGGAITGVPETIGGPTDFRVDIHRINAAGVDEGPVGIFWFRLTVWPPDHPPAIATTGLPDAMIGVPYDVLIETAFFPPGSVWALTTPNTPEEGLPPGLSIWWNPADTSNWAIRGTPREEAIPEGQPSEFYSFEIGLHQINLDFIPWVIEPVPLSTTVWRQPTIAPAPTTPITPPELFDGIANTNRDYNVRLVATGDAVAARTGWTWHVLSGNLPPGVNPTHPENDAVSLAGHPTEAGDFTFTLRFRANPTILVGWVDMTYTITIVEPPKFSPETFTLPDGMDSYRTEPGEPEDRPYRATIRAERFPDVDSVNYAPSRPPIEWNWTIAGGELPPGNPDVPLEERLHFRPLPTMNEMAEIYGMPRTDSSRPYNFEVEITATSSNPNINGAVIARQFSIMMWERRFLNIEVVDPEARSLFVRRATVPGAPVDVDWDESGWTATAEANRYRFRRAVMPGTDGQIRVPLSGTGFVRWEVVESATAPSGNANRFVNIGGPDRYSAVPGNPNAFVLIEMPSFRTENGNHVPVDGDVYIRGVDDARSPVWTQSTNPLEATVGDEDSIIFVSIANPDVGRGDRPMSWELISPEYTFPPGLDFDRGNSRTSFITSGAGGPLIDDTFIFTLGINLPGSMRLERQFELVVNPIPGVLLGDVNGDGQRNLADLVMLQKFVREEISSLPNPDAGNIVTPRGTRPSGADLLTLARFFGRMDESLTAPPPPPSTPEP